MGQLRPGQMNDFGQWLIPLVSTEEDFEIERHCRLLLNTPNAGPIAAQLFRAMAMQQQLLQQATHEIARLELMVMSQNTSP